MGKKDCLSPFVKLTRTGVTNRYLKHQTACNTTVPHVMWPALKKGGPYNFEQSWRNTGENIENKKYITYSCTKMRCCTRNIAIFITWNFVTAQEILTVVFANCAKYMICTVLSFIWTARFLVNMIFSLLGLLFIKTNLKTCSHKNI